MARSDTPYSHDAEQLVLGLCIDTKEAWATAANRLDAGAFHQDAHRRLWRAIKQTYDERNTCSTVFLFESLGTDIQTAGGRDYINQLVLHSRGKDLTAAIDIVHEKHRSRRAQEIGEAVASLAKNEAAFDSILATAAKLHDIERASRYQSTAELVTEAIDHMHRSEATGPDFTTGWAGVDKKVGGFYKGLTYVIGGWTSHGKTTALANIVAANMGRNPVVYYNGFENPRDWLSRLASITDGVPLMYYTRPEKGCGSRKDQAVKSLQDFSRGAADRLIVDAGVGYDRMVAVCEERRPDIVIVDYIQTYASDRRAMGKEDSYAHFVGKCADDLRRLSIKYNCVMLIASQLGRPQGYSPTNNKEPHLYQLKESGDIENVADAVFLLHWPWRDEAPTKPDGGSADTESPYYIITAKNKCGTIGMNGLKIDHKTLAITDWTTNGYAPPVQEPVASTGDILDD